MDFFGSDVYLLNLEMRETFIYFEFLIKKKQHELYLISASFIYYKLKTLALYTCNAEIKIKNKKILYLSCKIY